MSTAADPTARSDPGAHTHAIPSLKAKDYKSHIKPVWCPGCGHFGVLSALTKTLAYLELPPTEVAVISGIGCSSRLPAYLDRLRLPRRARTRAGAGLGAQGRAPGTDRHRRRRRRRRLLHRRQSLPARLSPQPWT
jgi:TPP-dependent indolepyruvate ferredoxin oxidoreductase alpha subunit